MRLWVATMALTLALAGCGKSNTKAPAKPTNTASGQNPLTAPADYVGAVGQAKRVAEKVVDTASLNQTILLFHEQEDRYPKNLQELVTMHYLPALPRPPYGMKFQYDPQTGQVKVVKAQ
jgi:hypothetical protein